MNNDDLVAKFGKMIDEKLEPIKRDLQDVKQDISILKNGQAQINTALAQNTTMVEAALAGQQELQKTTAREASVQDLKAALTRKVNDHEERIIELEKEVGIPHPHKH